MTSFFFVRPQTSSCMYHFLQTSLVYVYSSVQSLLGLRWTQRSRVRILALARNFFEQFFSALCDFFIFFSALCYFFRFFFVFKGSHLQGFFDILQQTKVPKSPKGLPFYVFRHYETVQNSHFCFFSEIEKNRFFVSKGPPTIYLIFCNKLDFQKTRRVPLLQV